MRKTRFNPDHFHPNQIPMYLVLVPLAIFMAVPIVFIVNHAFKPIEELFAFPPRFLVENPVMDNFTRLARQASAGGISIRVLLARKRSLLSAKAAMEDIAMLRNTTATVTIRLLKM